MAGLDGLVWVFAIVLAIVFLVMGFFLVRTNPAGRNRMAWAESAPRGLTLPVGIIMLAGALCLVVPLLIPELAWLTPLAAFILAALMLGIAQSYLAKRDREGAAVYILLMLMLAALAFARWSAVTAQFG